MNLKKRKNKKQITLMQKQNIWSFFTLLFPSLLISIILTCPRETELIVIGFMLFFYQAVLLKNFIEKYNPDY